MSTLVTDNNKQQQATDGYGWPSLVVLSFGFCCFAGFRWPRMRLCPRPRSHTRPVQIAPTRDPINWVSSFGEPDSGWRRDIGMTPHSPASIPLFDFCPVSAVIPSSEVNRPCHRPPNERRLPARARRWWRDHFLNQCDSSASQGTSAANPVSVQSTATQETSRRSG
jgi:hypothetical protein